MPIGLSNKLPIFLHFGKFTTKWVIQVYLAFVGWGSTPQTGRGSLADLLISWRQSDEVPIIPGPGSAARSKKTKENRTRTYMRDEVNPEKPQPKSQSDISNRKIL